MSGVIFSQMNGENDIYFGKFEAPIKAIISSEVDRGEKELNVLNKLFNIEKSNHYAETIMAQSGFSTFKPKKEGEIASNDELVTGYPKIIEHIEFAKEFVVTRKMVDDSISGMSVSMKREPKAFVTAYLDTKLELASKALANGTKTSMDYNGITVDLLTGDGKPLFSTTHPTKKGKTQSNVYSNAFTADNLYKLVVAFRNTTDDAGKIIGATPDVIVIPGNRPALEKTVTTFFQSMKVPGTNDNDANPFYQSMEVLVNPFWQATEDCYMLMSTTLNERLLGNMFFNRVDLDIMNEIDRKTRNLVWNGYCRFGVGFGSWKHILLAGSTGGTTLA